MKVLFLGRKDSGALALRWLVAKGHDVCCIVDPHDSRNAVQNAARELGIPSYDWCEAKHGKLDDVRHVDIGVSFLFSKRVKAPLLHIPTRGFINFHPAPLPDYKGVGGYNMAILLSLNEWGTSAHFMNENIDEGPIIDVARFRISPENETAYSLERRSQKVMLKQFARVVGYFAECKHIETVANCGGRYISRKELEDMKAIKPHETAEEIEKKIRAFWFPPYRGAMLEYKGKVFTLVSDQLLKLLELHGEIKLSFEEVFGGDA